MALTSSGALSLNEMHIEAGGSSGTECSLNDSDIRGLISKSAGASMAFNEWYSASASIPDFATTMTVGHTNHSTTIGYTTTAQASKGFLYTIPIVEFLFKELLILLEILMSGISKRLA